MVRERFEHGSENGSRMVRKSFEDSSRVVQIVARTMVREWPEKCSRMVREWFENGSRTVRELFENCWTTVRDMFEELVQ